MIKKTLMLIIILSIGINYAKSQNDSLLRGMDKNMMDFAPFHFLVRTFNVGYQRVLTENTALSFEYSFILNETNETSKTGFGVKVLYKYFLYSIDSKVWKNSDDNSRTLVYFAPVVYYSNNEYSDKDFRYPKNEYVENAYMGFAVGMLYIISKKVIADCYIGNGVTRTFKSTSRDNYLIGAGYNGIQPDFGLRIGYLF